MVEGVSGEADTPFTFPASPVQGEHVPLTNFTCGRACAGNLKTMNATQEMWLVIANGQKIMSREMLTMAQQASSADIAAQCIDLANVSSYIESRARGMALREASRVERRTCGCGLFKTYLSPVTGNLICPACGV